MINPGPYPLDTENSIESQTILVNVYLGTKHVTSLCKMDCDRDRWSKWVGDRRVGA